MTLKWARYNEENYRSHLWSLNHLTGKYLSLCSTVRTPFDPEDLLMDFGEHCRNCESKALRNQYDCEILLERPLPVLRMK